MNIEDIEYAIEVLESADSTVENVAELASLYIVKEHLSQSFQSMSSGSNDRLNELFPYYSRYIEIKKEYQLNKNTEGAVIQGIKDVCVEFTQFLDTLYSNTDMNKERRCIIDMINKLNAKYNK